MTSTIRLASSLVHAVRLDLSRPHAFAFERVGFLFARFAQALPEPLLLGLEYCPVRDEDYISDETVGARINGHAIRAAMQRALRSGECVLHIHAHENSGIPRFSATDLRTIMELTPSFRAVAPKAAHGAVVLSRDRASGMVWSPGDEKPLPARVVLLGPTISISRGES